MNNKTIIEFSFHILWRIMDISEGINAPWPTASMDNTLLDLHNSSYDTKAEFNIKTVLLFIQNNS